VDPSRLAEALRFALQSHGGQTRKGSDVPYASHLLQVSGLVLEHGGDEDQAVVGLLHDVLEDCEGVDAQMLCARFGDDVARMVQSLTDVLEGDSPGQKSDWVTRKRAYLAHLVEADLRTRLVAGCDKLHNLRSTVADLHREGPSTLERFTATPEQIRWYYESLRGALGPDLPARLVAEFDALLAELRRYVPEASPDGRPMPASPA
jgi:(p)ppGpp synthase/HD superfamily hydrolase